MFGLFKKGRREKPSVIYGLMQKVSEFVERRQRRAADYLNSKVAGCSKRQLKAGLFSFCLSFGSAAVYVIYNSFSGDEATVRVQSIRVPESSMLPKQKDSIIKRPVPKSITKIRAFDRYLDSLKQTREGKMIYDSIVRLRPGLPDSLEMTLELYEDHLKQIEYDNE
jgi:hypothetical protein